ncbi:Ca2+-dependent phosphoinositide-specific phospholipase C [Algibacter miyuki]|uniref:Ca2+-dependent phosphoinositide-specific phospholipase C n=1 Tax=Algibacter miyuki TaxID=1306933 RepID=A0ABV5H4R4_9FLAO|nr:Ca2+-dependent phosphoinositide-specific phospholipase C [Algibacter miyuki]MDN3665835.1 Ca2+-dependent phosphoinositide-specific phospholipase C [Algibacter miyuki]
MLSTVVSWGQSSETIELWTNKVPGESSEKQPAKISGNTSGNVKRLSEVTNPLLTVYRPEQPNASKAGIIVCPGGGYNILAIDKEGDEIAEWLNTLGYTAFVLQYRVPKNDKGAAQDIQRAIKIVRSKASEFQLDTNNIGLIGFSAGGHLSALASTTFKTPFYESQDEIDAFSSQSNFTMLIYPAYLDKGENKTIHPDFTLDKDTPPFFIFGTADDPYGNSSFVMGQALRDNKTPVELHVYPKGGHGYGLRDGNAAGEQWPKLAKEWLEKVAVSKPKLNDMQVIGSHNSYKIEIEKPLYDYLHGVSPKIESLQYGHVSLEKQLDLGLRNLELDVFYDPLGGHFSNPKGLDIVKTLGKTPLDFDIEEKLKKPGLKMFHVQDIDFRSHHLLFRDGLKNLKKWSDKHPNHTPVVILINTKDQEVPQTRTPLTFDKTALDSLDVEIRSVFSDSELITPDAVRGNFKTLEEAVLKAGWPELSELKGKFLFVLDEKEARINDYLGGHDGLKGRVLFVNSKEGNPEAAFRIINNPITDFEYIKTLVDKGYMVRTRADAGTKEARTKSYARFEKAKASGAQVISTDYYVPSTLFDSDFKIIFDDNTYEKIKN